MKAGINLFTLRKSIASEKDFLDTMLRLKNMGYSYVQFSGAPFDADMIARVSEESGLPVVLTHVPMDRIIGDTEALIDEHLKFGCKNIGLGAMPATVIENESSCKKKIEELECAGEMMAKQGLKFFYHHHHFEFYKHNGETVLDYMIKNTSHINFTADTYWIQYGGGNICDVFDKMNGRMGCVHLKDYLIDSVVSSDGKVKFEPRFAPVGNGTLDFKAIAKKAQECGAEYFLVEQDNAPDFPDPFAEVEQSINYIKETL